MVDIYLWQPLFTLDNIFALHIHGLSCCLKWAPQVTIITGKQEQGSCATVGGRVWRVWRRCPQPGHTLYLSIYLYSTAYLHIYRLESRMEDDHRNLESRLMELERLVEANREKVAASTSFREVSSDESEDA